MSELDVSALTTTTVLNMKIAQVENKIMDTSGLVLDNYST